jgi:hypothetical protein
MTTEQWDSIQGSLNSIRVLMFALAKTSENPAALRAAFQSQKEILEAFLSNSKMSDISLAAHRTKLSEIEKAIWE